MTGEELCGALPANECSNHVRAKDDREDPAEKADIGCEPEDKQHECSSSNAKENGAGRVEHWGSFRLRQRFTLVELRIYAAPDTKSRFSRSSGLRQLLP